MTQTVQFGDATVIVRQTDDGFEAEEQLSERQLVGQFAEDHEAIESVSMCSSHQADYKITMDSRATALSPGSGNIGTQRTDAEMQLAAEGLTLSLEWVEPSAGKSRWSIGVTVEDNR